MSSTTVSEPRSSLLGTKEKPVRLFSFVFCTYSFLVLADDFLRAADGMWPLLTYLRVACMAFGFAYMLRGKITGVHIMYLLALVGAFCTFALRSSIWESNFLELVKYASLGFVIIYAARAGRFVSFANSFFVAAVVAMALNFMIDPRELGLYEDVSDVISEYYGRSMWFTGYRNSFGAYFLLSTLIFLVGSGRPTHRRFWIAFGWGVLGLAMSIYVWAASAIVILLGMLIGMLVIRAFRLSVLQSVLIGVAAQLSVVFFGPSIMSGWMAEVLHRDATLTGRVWIWEFYLELIADNPYFGSGGYQTFIPELGREYTSHNSSLSVLYSFGLVGTILIAGLIWAAVGQSRRYRSLTISKFVSLFIFLFLIRGSVENDYSPMLAFLALVAVVPDLAAGYKMGFPRGRSSEDLEPGAADASGNRPILGLRDIKS